jgi:hypothetical protein
MAKGQITARVQCTIEVPVGTWSGGVTDMDALTEQVRREGRQIVAKAASDLGGCIVGDPRVFFVVLSEDVK